MTAAMTAPVRAVQRRAMTPITDVTHLPSMATGRREIFTAVSADGLWHFEHVDDVGTPWAVTHRPTDMQALMGSLPSARRWVNEPAALQVLEAIARENLAREFVLPEERDRSRRFLGWLDRLPPTVDPVALCDCGGYLAYGPGRAWRHVDTCADEIDDPDQPCPDNALEHRFCDRPSPAQCDHPQCVRTNDLQAVACDRGHRRCCGCCHGEA